MLRFLFSRKSEPKVETARETATRALQELNEVLAGMPERPVVAMNMAKGTVDISWPAQLPGESLALPAPADEAERSAA